MPISSPDFRPLTANGNLGQFLCQLASEVGALGLRVWQKNLEIRILAAEKAGKTSVDQNITPAPLVRDMECEASVPTSAGDAASVR